MPIMRAARWPLFAAIFFICANAFADGRAQPTLHTASLTISTSAGSYHFTVEMALSPEQRERGLMFRGNLAANTGMLFSSGHNEMVTMWMKNTPQPLDMIFIESDGTIANLIENAKPYSLETLSSGVPVRAVLEVAAGTARSLHIKPGDKAHNVLFGNALKDDKS